VADDSPSDISALIRNAARSAGRTQQERTQERQPVLREQSYRKEGKQKRGEAAAELEPGEDDGRPCWTLQGQPVRDGMVLEVYTNRANGFVRGQVRWSSWPERPRLALTLWNPWGIRDADGLPPKLGMWEVELVEGLMCRFTGALPEELD